MHLDPSRYYVEFLEACARFIRDKDCTKYFKKYDPELPRISSVVGILKSIRPTSLLDVGSGRGRSLWPILNELDVSILCVDPIEWRCDVINAVHNGGVKKVKATNKDILDFISDTRFEVVTALEVLEHIPLATQALKKIMDLAIKFVVITVPSKPDNNPEHVHFFSEKYITDMIGNLDNNRRVGKVQISYVRNSMIVLIGFKDE